jgi:hypothetical protein
VHCCYRMQRQRHTMRWRCGIDSNECNDECRLAESWGGASHPQDSGPSFDNIGSTTAQTRPFGRVCVSRQAGAIRREWTGHHTDRRLRGAAAIWSRRRGGHCSRTGEELNLTAYSVSPEHPAALNRSSPTFAWIKAANEPSARTADGESGRLIPAQQPRFTRVAARQRQA